MFFKTTIESGIFDNQGFCSHRVKTMLLNIGSLSQMVQFTLRVTLTTILMKIETDTSFSQSQMNSPHRNKRNIMLPIQLRYVCTARALYGE